MIFEINLVTRDNGPGAVLCSTDPALERERIQPFHSIGYGVNNHQLWPHAVG